MRPILRSGMGRAGVALITLLVVASIAVLTTFPRDFGSTVWGSPAYWADNPKLVPPFWVGLFDRIKTPHQVLEDATLEVVSEATGTAHLYRFRVKIAPTAPPTFLSFSLSGVEFWATSPSVEVYLVEGAERVLLHQHVVPDRREGETQPVRRYVEAPFRARLDADASTKESLRAFYGALRQAGTETFSAVVKMSVGDTRDRVERVKFVAGGHAFGWLGTDDVGRDIAQGILFGLPVALFVAFVVALFTTIIGAVIGGLSGYSGGWVDMLIQRVIDIQSNIPTLPIIIMLTFTIGPRLSNVVIFLIIFGWAGLVLQLRPWIFQIRETGFITYVQASGFSSWRIILRHILPQTSPFLFANFVLAAPGAILSEAALSFLGLGDPSFPSWGFILNQGFRTGALFLGYWWWVLPPGIAIVITTFAFRLIFDAMESATESRWQR